MHVHASIVYQDLSMKTSRYQRGLPVVFRRTLGVAQGLQFLLLDLFQEFESDSS